MPAETSSSSIPGHPDSPAPIPLRTLTTLLNYERCVSDPRFQGSQLVHSTLADEALISRVTAEMRMMLANKPPSIKQVHMHVFSTDSDESGTPAINDVIAKSAFPAAKALTFAQRESIYHEARGHDGCYKALALFQEFFKLCPPNQLVSIQIKKEDPILVSPFLRQIVEFTLKGPKMTMIATGMDGANEGKTVISGIEQEIVHSVVGFSAASSSTVDYVVDMTRMQFGDAGRGLCGELYFLGTMPDFLESMEKVCEDLEHFNTVTHIAPSEHTERLQACAARVWQRWQNRDTKGWCDYCGSGASPSCPLLRCTGCQKVKVYYCCKEHQISGWKLHKFTCEKVKK